MIWVFSLSLKLIRSNILWIVIVWLPVFICFLYLIQKCSYTLWSLFIFSSWMLVHSQLPQFLICYFFYFVLHWLPVVSYLSLMLQILTYALLLMIWIICCTGFDVFLSLHESLYVLAMQPPQFSFGIPKCFVVLSEGVLPFLRLWLKKLYSQIFFLREFFVPPGHVCWGDCALEFSRNQLEIICIFVSVSFS